jgi:hypothetical protein
VGYQRELAIVESCHLYKVRPHIYHVVLGGRLTRRVAEQLSDLVRHDHGPGKVSVLYETGPEFAGYDLELRSSYQHDAEPLKQIGHIGIITSSTILRMVSATVALGLRAAYHLPMTSHSTLEAAISAAQEALDQYTAARPSS